MKTKTQARTAPAVALRRVAVVAAVLLTLCLVFMMPVVAEEEVTFNEVSTFAELSTNLTEGKSVKLIADIPATASIKIPANSIVTLDLNGHTISGTCPVSEAHIILVENTATLNIMDSSSEKNGKITYAGSSSTGYVIDLEGTLNLYSGTIELTGTWSIGYCVDVRPNSWGTEYTQGTVFNMYGGKVVSSKDAIRVASSSSDGGPNNEGGFYEVHESVSSSFIMNDGEIEAARDAFFIQQSNVAYDILSVNIGKGTVSAPTPVRFYGPDSSSVVNNVEKPMTVTITGGTLDSTDGTQSSGTWLAEPVFKFQGGMTQTELLDKTTFSITGGTYDGDVSDHVADGYYAQKNADDTYTVKNTCDVTFDSNGGSEVTAEQVSYMDNVKEPTAPTKEGYTFIGWYLGENLYDFATQVTKDITLAAKWNENPKTGEAVEVKPQISVEITVDQHGTTSIDTSSSGSTTVEVEENTVTITDVSTEVEMKVTFDDTPTPGADSVSGKISSVEVTYPEKPAETTSQQEVTQQVIFNMNNVTADLPVIDSKKDNTVVEKVKKQEQRANVLAMITATHDKLVEINNNITEVKITFKVHASLISNSDFVKAYHVKGDTVDVLPDDKITITGPDGGFYTITITSDKKFSSYVLAEEIPQTTSSGSATDTGAGNYQYYPRSVPTDGIIDFGTSKVVTGMELPAGSDGTVTLNIKPTFTMPENGFYAFEIDAPGYNLDAKINGGLSFQIPVADLEAAGWTAEDIVLFHGTVGEDGKIVWEALPTNLVKNENGVAYYKAAINGCSPFYIGFVKDGSVVNTEVVDPVTPETPEQPVTPDEPEILPPVEEPTEEPETPASPAPILAVLAGLGAVVALRRK